MRRIGVLAALALICLFFVPLHPPAGSPSWQEQRNRRVLILRSCHAGFSWTDIVTEGIQSVFSSLGPDTDT